MRLDIPEDDMKAENIFEAFASTTILVVGDIMIDRYLQGNVERVSPEAPVPVVRLQNREDRLGGAANVALNIKALGGNPILCSVIGLDQNAESISRLMPEAGLSTEGILQSAHRITTVKSRILAHNQHLLRVDQEDDHDLEADTCENFLNRIIKLLNTHPIDGILFQDYNKGVLSLSIIRSLLLEAIKRDIPTTVDPKFKNFWAFKRATLFKPNLKEIRHQLNHSIEPNLASLRKAAKTLRDKLGNSHTMITLSEKGIFIDAEGLSEIIPTQERSIADVCGAGDTVISVATLGLASRLPMRETAILSNLAGGQVCEKVGVVPIDKEQLQREFVQLQKSAKVNFGN